MSPLGACWGVGLPHPSRNTKIELKILFLGVYCFSLTPLGMRYDHIQWVYDVCQYSPLVILNVSLSFGELNIGACRGGKCFRVVFWKSRPGFSSADGEGLEALVVVVHILLEEVLKGMDVLLVVNISKSDSLRICVDVFTAVLGHVDGFSDDRDEGVAVGEEPKSVVEDAPAVEDHWSDIDNLLQGLLKVPKF
mmetsp:Transcript_23220/g.92622  ORF Transcript_23220/g.92622 Transcript_23220/m.92622 type:complete len:193 (+) Transcript_23220:96-674(+)